MLGERHIFAGDIAHDVLPQQALDVLGNILSLYDQLLIPSNAALGPKLGHEELEEVLRTPLHHGAYLLEVDPQRLLGQDLRELRQLHCAALFLDEVRILHAEYPHGMVEHVLVGVVHLAVMHVILLAISSLVPCDESVLLGEAAICTVAPAATAAAAAAIVVLFTYYLRTVRTFMKLVALLQLTLLLGIS